MRCDQCNKFVSFDAEQDPELDASVDDAGVVTVQARIVNCCAECGAEMKEASLEVEIDLSGEVAAHRETCEKRGLEVQAEGSRTDRYQDKDRRGKPITRARYRRHYYGAEVTATVECECGETFEGSGSDEIAAGAMDELM